MGVGVLVSEVGRFGGDAIRGHPLTITRERELAEKAVGDFF